MTTATTIEDDVTYICDFGPVPSDQLDPAKQHELRMYRLSTDRTKALGDALAFAAQFDSEEVFAAFVDITKDEAYFTFEMKANTRPLTISLRYKSDRWSPVESSGAHSTSSRKIANETPLKNRGVKTIYHAFLDEAVLEKIAELLRTQSDILDKLLTRINFKDKTLALVAAEDAVEHMPEMEAFKTAIIPKAPVKEAENMNGQEETSEAKEELNESAEENSPNASPPDSAADDGASNETTSDETASGDITSSPTSSTESATSDSALSPPSENEAHNSTSSEAATSESASIVEESSAPKSNEEPPQATPTETQSPEPSSTTSTDSHSTKNSEAETAKPSEVAPAPETTPVKLFEPASTRHSEPKAAKPESKSFEPTPSKSFDASPAKSPDRPSMKSSESAKSGYGSQSSRSGSNPSLTPQTNDVTPKYHTYSQSEVDALIRRSAENVTSTATTKINAQTKAVKDHLKEQEKAFKDAMEKLASNVEQANAKLDKAASELNEGTAKQVEAFRGSLNKELEDFKVTYKKDVLPGIKILDSKLEQLAEAKKQSPKQKPSQSSGAVNPNVITGIVAAIVVIAVLNIVVSLYAFDRISNLEKNHAEMMLKSNPSGTSDVPIPDLMKEQIDKEQTR